MQPTLFMKLVWGYFQTKRRLRRAISFLFFGDEYKRAVEETRFDGFSFSTHG